MERIRQALEQAEKERESGTAQQKAEPPAVPPSPNISTIVTSSPVETHGLTQTKSVEVPDDVLEANRLVAGIQGHALSDVYRVLRTRVLQGLTSNGWNSVAITSPASGCGKSLTAINLAYSLARELTHTVLLVDLDLRAPSVHKYFGYRPEFGIGDYLFQDDLTVQELLFSPGIDRLVVLPGRNSVHNSSEMLRSPKMVQLVTELKSRYRDRIVIFDLAPVLSIDDALSFAPYTDSFLMIAENNRTTQEDLEKALDLLKDYSLLGTVLNKSEPQSRYGYYGYAATDP